MEKQSPRIGLALGSGSARGWAHIGVIRALADNGIKADIVCGSSIGALVGASLVCGQLDALEKWLRNLTVREMIRLMDISVAGGGLIHGNKLAQALCHFVDDTNIESLPMDYGAIATDLDAGREVWFRDGSLLTAVRASIALPGLFAPVEYHNRWLVDGGLVNPVPVSMCRAMGADIVIAVNLSSELAGSKARFAGRKTRLALSLPQSELIQKIVDTLAPFGERAGFILPPGKHGRHMPGMFETMAGSIDIMQDRITKSRLAGDPPDILISPHLAHMGLLEFDRVEEAIEEGMAAVQAARAAGAFRQMEAVGNTLDRAE